MGRQKCLIWMPRSCAGGSARSARRRCTAAELDELEDHLRARVNLEMELMVVPNRRRAFALARDGLGESTALSSEFAKAGTPRWRKLLIAGLGDVRGVVLPPGPCIAPHR